MFNAELRAAEHSDLYMGQPQEVEGFNQFAHGLEEGYKARAAEVKWLESLGQELYDSVTAFLDLDNPDRCPAGVEGSPIRAAWDRRVAALHAWEDRDGVE